VFLGADLPLWLLLAFGGALAAGNLMALIRPPGHDPDQPRPPLTRTIVIIFVGLAAAVWALISLIAG